MRCRLVGCCVVFSLTVSWIACGASVVLSDSHLSSETQPVTLADGKVVVSGDGTGAVTYLRMNPDTGETLTLSGTTLRFADGARIIAGQGGESCLSNAFSAAGALSIGVPVQSYYTGTMLPSNSYAVLFRNLRLEDISPVSTDFSKNTSRGMPQAKGYPYFIRRSKDTMTVQFQVLDSKNVKGVLLELKQTGDDISGKVLDAAYFSNKPGYLGYDMFYEPTIAVTDYAVNAAEYKPTYGYGIAELTIGPRRETYDYREKFLSDEEDIVVAENVAVEELEFLYGADGANKSVLKGMSREVMKPYHVKFEDGTLSAQFQLLNSSTVKGVKVLLRQQGADVVARIDYARYRAEGVLGCDLDVVGTEYNVMTEEEYSPTAYGYSLDLLALRRKSRNRLEIPVEGLLDMTNALSGSGMELTFSSVPRAASADLQETVRVEPLLCGKSFVTLAAGVSLSELTLTAGKLGGTWGGRNNGPVMAVQDWRNDGMSADCQMQALDGTTLKAIDVALRQYGDEVQIRCVRTIYIADTGAEFYGKKMLKSTDPGAVVDNAPIATSATGSGYALMYAEYRKSSGAYVRAAAANSMTDTAIAVKGDAACPMTFSVCHADALPEGSIDVFDGAALDIPVDALFAYGIGQGRALMTMHPGSRLRQSGNHVFYSHAQQVVLDGAELYPQYGTTAPSYYNYLTLSGGALVHDGILNCAHSSEDPVWRVTGAVPCTNDATLVLFANTKGVASEFTFDVGDTGAGEAADLVMNGAVLADEDFPNTTFLKKGAGTMLVNGALACTNLPVRIVEGTVRLGGGKTTGMSFSLEGGTLAVAGGAAHDLRALTVTAASSVHCGEAAALAADDLEIAENAVLSLSSTGRSSGVVVSATLDEDTLSRIRLNGKYVRQAESGMLVEDIGLVLIVR